MQRLHKRIAGLTGEDLRHPDNADSAVTAWGKLYRADIVKQYAFTDTKLIGTEDALFTLQAFCSVKKAVYIDKCFHHYRKDNDASLTNK